MGLRPHCLLRSWVRIPPGAWILVCCECRVLPGRGLCDELITRPEESYRLWCVVVWDLETSRISAPHIYDISNLRVKLVQPTTGWYQEKRIEVARQWKGKAVGRLKGQETFRDFSSSTEMGGGRRKRSDWMTHNVGVGAPLELQEKDWLVDTHHGTWGLQRSCRRRTDW